MEAKMEVYDEEGNVLKTSMHRAWFTWAEEEVELCIALPYDADGNGVQLTIPRKDILEALAREL